MWKENNPFFCESQTPQTVWETKFTVNENLSAVLPRWRFACEFFFIIIFIFLLWHYLTLTLLQIKQFRVLFFFCYHLEKSMMSFSHLPAAHIGASRPDPTRPGSGLWQTSWRLWSGTPVVCWEASSPGRRLRVSRRPVFVPQNESPDGPFTGGRCRAAAGNIWPSHPYLASWRNLPKSTGTRHRGFLFYFFFLRISWNGMIGITSSTGRDGRGSRPYSSNTAAFLWQRSDWSCFVKFLLYKRSLLRMDLESCIKWHLQVLPRGMTLIRIIHDPLQNNRLERNTTFSRRYFPGSALPFSHSLWRQIKNSLGSHWCQCLHSCLHRKAPWKIIKPTSSWAPWILKRLNTDFQSHFPRSDRGRERRLFVCVLLYRGCL